MASSGATPPRRHFQETFLMRFNNTFEGTRLRLAPIGDAPVGGVCPPEAAP